MFEFFYNLYYGIDTETHTIENTLSLKQTMYGLQGNHKHTGPKRDFITTNLRIQPIGRWRLLVMSQIAGIWFYV